MKTNTKTKCADFIASLSTGAGAFVLVSVAVSFRELKPDEATIVAGLSVILIAAGVSIWRLIDVIRDNDSTEARAEEMIAIIKADEDYYMKLKQLNVEKLLGRYVPDQEALVLEAYRQAIRLRLKLRRARGEL